MAGPRAALIALLLLPGCAGEAGEHEAQRMREAFVSAQAGLAVVPARAVAATPSPGTAASLPGPRQRGAAPPATAAALVGSRADQLRRLLGEPALRRPEGDAEIWLYEAATCRVDLVLYPEGGVLAVGHASARAHGGAEGVTEADCLSAIAAAPATLPWIPPGGRRA